MILSLNIFKLWGSSNLAANKPQLKPAHTFDFKNMDSSERKKILASNPEVFNRYPELKELAVRMLSFGSYERFRDAIKNGVIAPSIDRDKAEYLRNLERTSPEKFKRFKRLNRTNELFNELYNMVKTLTKDPSAHIPYEVETLLGKKLNPQVKEKLTDLYNQFLKAEEDYLLMFPQTSLLEDFGVYKNPGAGYVEDFRYDAEIGDLYGYEQKDIMAYGFSNCLERIVGDVCYHDFSSSNGNWPLVIKDWDFVAKFYSNAESWKHQTALA